MYPVMENTLSCIHSSMHFKSRPLTFAIFVQVPCRVFQLFYLYFAEKHGGGRRELLFLIFNFILLKSFRILFLPFSLCTLSLLPSNTLLCSLHIFNCISFLYPSYFLYLPLTYPFLHVSLSFSPFI